MCLSTAYKERFQPRYGFLRPIIPEVVEKFFECGDLAPGFVMAIHTFGEYLDFHSHLHALDTDGLFARSGSSTSCPRLVSSP